MRFDEFIVVDSINPNLKATNKEDAIREMAHSLVDAGKLPEEGGGPGKYQVVSHGAGTGERPRQSVG